MSIDQHPGIPKDQNPIFYSLADYDCSVQKDRSIRDSERWFQTAVRDWDNPDPDTSDFSLKWLGTETDRSLLCYVGTRTISEMNEPFDWYLQAVSILHESEKEAGNGEPYHTLGGGRLPATSPSHLSASWPTDTARKVGTPQTNAPLGALPENMTAYPSNADQRTFLSHVQPLSYPPRLSETAGHHPDCGTITAEVTGLPICSSNKCSWFGFFGRDPNDPSKESSGNLWAWWGQQISEVRQQVTPVPLN